MLFKRDNIEWDDERVKKAKEKTQNDLLNIMSSEKAG
jgi:hypothetical protein